MPPAAKKRKNLATAQSSITPSQQRSIQGFGRVSKAQVHEVGKSNLKRKHVEEAQDVEDEELKRRKRAFIQDLFKLQHGILEQEFEKPTTRDARKRKASPEAVALHLEPPSTPAKNSQRKKAPLRSKQVTETPTKGARSLLENFVLAASSSLQKGSSPTTSRYETPSSSPPSIAEDITNSTSKDVSQPLPEQIQDLINLYSSFLNALSLYYAHNGLSNPADLRNLYLGLSAHGRSAA